MDKMTLYIDDFVLLLKSAKDNNNYLYIYTLEDLISIIMGLNELHRMRIEITRNLNLYLGRERRTLSYLYHEYTKMIEDFKKINLIHVDSNE